MRLASVSSLGLLERGVVTSAQNNIEGISERIILFSPLHIEA